MKEAILIEGGRGPARSFPHVFDFNEQPVRIMEREEVALFANGDVCRVLSLKNPSKAGESLDEDEKITLTNAEGNPRAGIPNQMVWLTESGLYTLIFKSRKPQAKVFRKWVTSEVLPAIRRNGAFQILAVDSSASSAAEEFKARAIAIEQPVTIPQFVSNNESCEGWRARDHVRFGKLVHLTAKAWGIPAAQLSCSGFGLIRAFPRDLLLHVIQDMPKRIKPSVEANPDERDFCSLVAWFVENSSETRWNPDALRKIAVMPGKASRAGGRLKTEKGRVGMKFCINGYDLMREDNVSSSELAPSTSRHSPAPLEKNRRKYPPTSTIEFISHRRRSRTSIGGSNESKTFHSAGLD